MSIGVVGYHVSAIAPAAEQFGKFAAKAIPFVGAVVGGVALAYDAYRYNKDYNDCVKGNSGG